MGILEILLIVLIIGALCRGGVSFNSGNLNLLEVVLIIVVVLACFGGLGYQHHYISF